MDGFLLPDERAKALEDGVDVADGGVEVEDDVEVDATRDPRVVGDELTEVALLLPRAHRVLLDKPVRVVAREAAVDERQQEPMAEVETVARVEVSAHPVGVHDEHL